tara:strand:+ start:1335 stop:1667 length:333 start_codon:yes stop_codon:yes gene_type:complete
MIIVTQHLRPNGETRKLQIERTREIEDLAEELDDHYVELACELLPSDKVFICSEKDGVVIFSTLVPNGPGVPCILDSLIKETHKRVIGHNLEKFDSLENDFTVIDSDIPF